MSDYKGAALMINALPRAKQLIADRGYDALRFGDYLNSIPLPAMLAVFKAVEWDNYGSFQTPSGPAFRA